MSRAAGRCALQRHPAGASCRARRRSTCCRASTSTLPRAARSPALVGPSGTGKSTLLHIAGLLERPSAGEVAIDGRACGRLADAERTRLRRERIGFVYQFHHLLPDFTALENVVLPLLIAGRSQREARGRARERC